MSPLIAQLFRLAALPLGAAGAFAQTPAAAAPESATNFELVPRVFQRNPKLDMTVITEVTPAGKRRPAASAQAPVYYLLHSAGHVARGGPTAAKPAPAAQVEAQLRHALATGGFLPAAEAHPPSLLIVYYWGMHAVVAGDNSAISPEQVLRNIFERAALVGGEKFAAELAQVAQRSAGAAAATAAPLGRGNDPDSMDLGAAAGLNQMSAVMDPVKLFMQRSARNEFLVNQATDDCYYVVASAFDYQSAAKPGKELLWRTRMTVGARAVGEADALPAVLAAAAPYLGREMPEAAILSKRVFREGSVEVGVPTIVEPARPPPPK